MKHSIWRMAPSLFFTFLLFLAASTAREEAETDFVRHPPSGTSTSELAPQKSQSDSHHGGHENEQADTVREATSILRKIRPPAISKLARYTSKPRGVLGTSAYYAKEAFVLLFMNTPISANLLTTSTSERIPKLPASLSKALRLLEDAAAQGDADALFLLAEMNFHGNFTHPVSLPNAFRYYQQLADLNGNSTAQYMLGFMYATGLNPEVPADQAKSLLYHTFAAEQGNSRSEMTLGYRHHAGIATAKNCDEAVHWYKRVADKAVEYYRSGPPGGLVLVRDSFKLADEEGGVYGEGASVSSAGPYAKQGGPTSDAYADVEDVLEYLHLQSSKGDLKSTFGLARLHYDGARGLKRDLRLAKQNFMQVARSYWSESGKVRREVPSGTEKIASKAAGYLGRMFLRGEGIEQSYSKARIWFSRGLQSGDALCQYSLGLMHLRGLGMPQDTVKASEYLAAAADQDLAVAQTHLGTLFLDQGDTVTATKYFELAARNSHIEAFYYLAEMNNHAIGRERSCGIATVYYKIVAEKAEQIWSSLSEANEAHSDGDTQKALVGYLMAAEQGSENAQANVAWILDRTKPSWSPITWVETLGQLQAAEAAATDAALALLYWTRSAMQNNIDSLVKMGDYYLAGIGALASAEKAAACYQTASESLQSAQAMWNLGWMHENGVGIEQDFHLAKRFYDQALDTNPKEAYLPVKLSLWKLRWRSWYNDVTHGGVKSIGSDEQAPKRRTFAEWVNDFLEADAQMYAQEFEADDWDAEHDHLPGGDEYWDGGEDEIDDGLLETLLIGGLVAALGWLVYYRQQQQRAAEQRRLQRVGAAQQDGEQQGGVQHPPQPPPPEGGFFPQPGDPQWGAWVAGGANPV